MLKQIDQQLLARTELGLVDWVIGVLLGVCAVWPF